MNACDLWLVCMSLLGQRECRGMNVRMCDV